ncbi:hypothetical protein Dimus_026102 [Dionaea muscipula]
MAASSKFDLSASADKPFGSTGQHGPFSSTSFDRSGSFRENMENPMISSLPSMPRSSSAVTQEDVINFSQCLRFDPKSVVADYKLYRQGELKRIVNTAGGISQVDSPSSSSKGKSVSLSPEEQRKLRAELQESTPKARERVKIFSEALSVSNKCFPSIPSRRRSRMDLMSGDRANAVLSSDRPGFSPSISKMGNLVPALGNALEVDQQRPEERAKSSVISKRTRTSLLDSRSNSIVRTSMLVDKDRDVSRTASSGAVLGEDRSLSVAIDGWEKSNIKKKRSGIKPDSSPSKLANKPVDGYRDPKQGIQQRLATDVQSRLNDSHGFRPGVGNEVAGVGKPGGVLQQNGSTVHSAFGRGDQEKISVAWDKKDRATASDKQRVNFKTVNKSSMHEDYSSASPTPSTKVPATARAPRSGAGNLPKLCPTVHRQSASSDWDFSQSVERPSAYVGPNNRKRTPSARSSSPPVAHWAGQRPQKISRTARRTNFLPIVSNDDEPPALDNISDGVGNDNGSASRRFPSSSPQRVKLKGEHISSAALSESEDSGVAETKFKDRKKMCGEVDDKAGQSIQKGSPILLPPRKNKLVNGEDLVDGVRRQGRSGRGSTSMRSLTPTTFEKLGNVGTAKQLRTPKIGYERAESKAGRPPTRKISDRRAYTRLKHSVAPIAVDFPGPGDGPSELLAAAKAVFIPCNFHHLRVVNVAWYRFLFSEVSPFVDAAHESSFWRFMEPIFGFICEADIIFLKQQEECMSTLFLAAPDFTDADNSVILGNGFGPMEHEMDSGFALGTERVDNFLELLTLGKRGPDAIPLFQRLLAALVTEENVEGHCHGTNEGIQVDDFEPEFQLDAELDIGTLGYGLMGNLHTMGSATLNGIRITTAFRRTPGELEGYEEREPTNQLAGIQNSGAILNFSHSTNGLLPESQMMPNNPEYMSIEERLLLEIQGIGIFPAQHFLPDQLEVRQTDNDEISEEIRKLAKSYQGLVSRKIGFNDKLLKLASETREYQEKVYEQCAFDKLVIMAYGKYMGWDSSSGGKNHNSKVVRQASLPFVRRTLDHCRKYEATGNSCFNGPLFKDIYRSGTTTRLADARSVDAIMEGESARSYPTTLQQVDQNMDVHSPSAFAFAFGKEDFLSNKVKKRELLLDNVGGNVCSSGGTLLGNAKGKRSERDREGKGGQSRDGLSRNSAARPGRPAAGNAKGERKSKAKPKQKTTQLSTSFHGGVVEKNSEQRRAVFPSGPGSSHDHNTTDSNNTGKDEFCLEFDDPDLRLPGIDVDLGGQGQDLGSWLNIDDDGLHDLDFTGLGVPMDDLSNINVMV